ncbi:MAG: DUF499 domain-containing protein, partial [Christensenellaceae bacterium]|nr:DUF499 domain-containing protein [Christensenellaceae bacterium]
MKSSVIDSAFELLREALAKYMVWRLRGKMGADEWWVCGVQNPLESDFSELRQVNTELKDEEKEKFITLEMCFKLVEMQWELVLKKHLSEPFKVSLDELKKIYTENINTCFANLDNNKIRDTLDNISKLCRRMDYPKVDAVNELLNAVIYQTPEKLEKPQKTSEKNAVTFPSQEKSKADSGSYRPWREIIRPHSDVTEGRYTKAEFAADLQQVALMEANYEYRDPVEFFNRTFLTNGIKCLLKQALLRVARKDNGAPIIRLKTPFGGGKTHSLLALYHLLSVKNSKETFSKFNDDVKCLVAETGLSTIPEVHVAVVVGTALSVTSPKTHRIYTNDKDSVGYEISVNTLWGEIAAQIAKSAKNPELYTKEIRIADEKSMPPGSDELVKLFNNAGSCLILLDELIAYARPIYSNTKNIDLTAGTSENFTTFLQQLTEAAKKSNSSLVVASLPESDVEIGGEAGSKVLNIIDTYFSRLDELWSPITDEESFEIVRRRLFLKCEDTASRDAICSALQKMYQSNDAFPHHTTTTAYLERMISCYPIHPEIFDRIYKDWATLEKFQRTRGALRLMATVVNQLWMDNDALPIILPSSFPWAGEKTRDEMVKYLDDSWKSVLHSDVDGISSTPYQIDQGSTRFSECQAARRVARTIMLGSAPPVSVRSIRGIDKSEVLLGSALPNNKIENFTDALTNLKDKLTYLFNDDGHRFWYDTKKSIGKYANELAMSCQDDEIYSEIENQIDALAKTSRSDLKNICVCPKSSADIKDDQYFKLVVLHPSKVFSSNEESNLAKSIALDFLNKREDHERIFRNTLVFLATDKLKLDTLKKVTALYLAWTKLNLPR